MKKTVRLFTLLLLGFPVISMAQTSNSSGYGAASYHSTNAGNFLKSWLLAGPVPVIKDMANSPDAATQEKFFNEEQIVLNNIRPNVPLQVKGPVSGKIRWLNYTSPIDQVNFDSVFKNADFVKGYALAEIKSDRDMPVILGVGSDDAVKVFLNGKLVHKNWIPRGVNADDDVVPIDLVKGSNQLLIEIQDIEGGWGFIARFLDKNALGERLIKAAAMGNLEQIRMLIKRGADINLKGKTGLNALQVAKINGRGQVEKLLIGSGAHSTEVPSAEKMVDGLYSYLDEQQHPGIAVLVSKEGKIVYKKGFGYADLKNKQRIDTEHKFRIGSITKQFTASAILKLREEGKLTVKDKLSKYFPDFPRADEVTIHHLLTHTSGIHSYTNTDSFLARVTSPITNEGLLNYFKNIPYDFDPGEKYQYNNSGYFLLGYIVEKISGESFDQYLKHKFFDPLGMHNTGVYKNEMKPEHEAIGYNKNNNGKYDTALNWDMSWAAGAGALYSTVDDLYKWNEALFNGGILSAESYKAAFTPVILNNGKTPPGTEYGYGWGINTYRGYEVLGHSGGLHGFISQLARYPKENMTIVMLTNQTPVEVMLDPNKIAELFVWQKLDSQSSYEVIDPKNLDLKSYDGNYDFSNGAILTITHEGTSLFAQLTGQSKFEIFPSKTDEFFWKVVEAKIKFNRNDKGEVVSAYMEQGNFTITAPKIKSQR